MQVNDVPGLVITETDHAPVIDRDMRAVSLSAEDIDEIGVLEQRFGRLFAARDAEFRLQIAHTGRALA